MTFPKSRSINPLAGLSKSLRWLLAGIRISLSNLAPWVGHPGDLLFQSALGLGAPGAGAGFFDLRCLGSLDLAYAADDRGLCGDVSWRGGLVEQHQPSHDRPWRPEVAVMPRAFIDGDRVRITGVRNFEYRSRDDFTVRYEEREVSSRI